MGQTATAVIDTAKKKKKKMNFPQLKRTYIKIMQEDIFRQKKLGSFLFFFFQLVWL